MRDKQKIKIINRQIGLKKIDMMTNRQPIDYRQKDR